jgi:hypothetical protein
MRAYVAPAPAIRDRCASSSIRPRAPPHASAPADILASRGVDRNNAGLIPLFSPHEENEMKRYIMAAGLLAALSVPASAQQTTQTQQTGKTSQGVTSNSSGMTSPGVREGTVGLGSGSGPQRGSPNGSPAAAPKATTGPNAQPSNDESPPK